MDYNKVFELGPWPMNLLLCIYEEDDWSVLKKKLPTDYHGSPLSSKRQKNICICKKICSRLLNFR